jgi:hypothetical protein
LDFGKISKYYKKPESVIFISEISLGIPQPEYKVQV